MVSAARADTPVVRVTAGEHPGFGRVVLTAPGLTYTLRRDGGQVLIALPGAPTLILPPKPPGGVLAMRSGPDGLELTISPEATVHDQRLDARIVVDIAAPPPVTKPAPPAATKPAPPAATDRPAIAPPATALRLGRESDPVATISAPPAPASDAHATGQIRAAAPHEPDAADRSEAAPHAIVAAAPNHGDTAPAPVHTDIAQPAQSPPTEAPPEDQAQGAPSWPVTGADLPSGPVALAATLTAPPAGVTGPTIQIPFTGPTGAAMFARGPDTYIVFDERRPIDLAAPRGDPVFGQASVSIHPAATVIRLPIPAGRSALLSRGPGGWRISVVSASPAPAALAAVPAKGALEIAAAMPGQVVAITDPQTGGTLLAGTQRTPGQAVLTERRAAEFILGITGQGVVVEPLSDAIGLRASDKGFVLTGPRSGLALSAPPAISQAMLDAAALTRRFEFPGQTTGDLAWRAKTLTAAAGAAPPLARGVRRLALAENLLSLGMGVEAATVLRAAAEDDPKMADSPDRIGLSAIAALLANRLNEAGGLDDPRLNGTDEIALWRALRTAMADDASAPAAAALATAAPLLLTYPDELRRRVLPLAMETMILGGQGKAAARLLAQRPDDPRLAYARALLKQTEGDNAGALAGFEALTFARSPLDHARAAVRVVETKLAMGKLDSKAAAEALEKRLYAWRGDQRDLRLRQRIAELDRAAGAWRAVFAVLRGAKQDFPSRSAEIDRQLKDAFAALPRDPAMDRMPPTELIGLLEENTELLADGPEGEPMRERLAEKLMALDLPKRADPVLQTLTTSAPAGPARASFGATLAALRLHEGNLDGATAALADSQADDLPPATRERRALIAARVEAKRGHAAAAVSALAGLDTGPVNEARATILEDAQDWPAAVDALTILSASAVPPEGKLDDGAVRLLSRLATAATHANDTAALTRLRETYRDRIGPGAMGDMFRLLTEAPVRGTADLDRARAEIGLARAVTTATASTGKAP